MAKRYMKKPSPIIREMQFKITMRFGLTTVKMTIIEKTIDNKCCQGCDAKETIKKCSWGYIVVQSL
jgi:hypothetical protein